MSCLDGVSLKIPCGFLEEGQEELKLITAPEITLPDYLKILQDTEYVFSLENWVLTGLQSGYQTLCPRSSREQSATCPPYWMMFSSPQESRLASRWSSDFWEPNPRPRSRSLNAAHYRAMKDRVKYAISDSEDEEFEEDGATHHECKQGGKKYSSASGSSNFLKLPCTQREGNVRQSSLRKTNLPKINLQRTQKSAGHPSVSFMTSNNCLPSECISSLRNNKETPKPQGSPAPSRPLNSHAAALDCSVELLSALSPEERELLSAITERGYPLRTAIIALQKTGQQSPEQVSTKLPIKQGVIIPCHQIPVLERLVREWNHKISSKVQQITSAELAFEVQSILDTDIERNMLKNLDLVAQKVINKCHRRHFGVHICTELDEAKQAYIDLAHRGLSMAAAATMLLPFLFKESPRFLYVINQILRYLVACDRLCELGYDEAQVEEALEMFQNCEAKAEEFLHLLAQFNEMGFQQNTIKEVLLLHENHRERALEELMTRVA